MRNPGVVFLAEAGPPHIISFPGSYHSLPVFPYLLLNKFFVFTILPLKNLFTKVINTFVFPALGYFWFLLLITLKPFINWLIIHSFIHFFFLEFPLRALESVCSCANVDLPLTGSVPLGKLTFLNLFWKAKMTMVLTSKCLLWELSMIMHVKDLVWCQEYGTWPING